MKSDEPVIYTGFTSQFSSVNISLVCTAIVVIVSTLFPGFGFGGAAIPTAIQLAGLVLGAVAIAIVLVLWKSCQSIRVAVSENGLTVVRRRSIEEWNWDEFDKIYLLDVTNHRGIKVAIHSPKRAELKLTHGIRNARELITNILSTTTPRKFAKIKHEFAAGHTLRFGPLELDKNEMRYGKMSMRWDELRECEVHFSSSPLTPKGTLLLTIWKKKRVLWWASIKIAEIPDFFILLILFDHLGHDSTEQLDLLGKLIAQH